MIDQFNHGAAAYDLAIEQFVETTPLDLPENWEDVRSDKYVPADALERKHDDLSWQRGWLAGWRDITSAHVNRTVIASIFPRTATDDTLSLILPKDEAEHAATLVANLNSLSLDYVARQKVGGTHIRKYDFPVSNSATGFLLGTTPRFRHPSRSGTHLHLLRPRPLRPRSGL